MSEFDPQKPTPRHTVRLSPVDEHTRIEVTQAGEHIRIATITIETTEGPYEITVWQDGELARRIARAIAPGSVREAL